jgi:hypothetical protein
MSPSKYEWIVVRGRRVWAELLYVSGRGDYRAYLHNGQVYRVLTP